MKLYNKQNTHKNILIAVVCCWP